MEYPPDPHHSGAPPGVEGPPVRARRAKVDYMNTPSPRSRLGRPVTSPLPELKNFVAGPRPITFWLAGKPIPQGRARMSRYGHVFDPKRSRVWKEATQHALRIQMERHHLMPFTGPLKIYYEAVFEPPRSYPIAKREAALSGSLMYTKPPDLDNLLKILLDAMNGIIFLDDRQVRKIQAEKNYGPEDGVLVTIIERPPLQGV